MTLDEYAGQNTSPRIDEFVRYWSDASKLDDLWWPPEMSLTEWDEEFEHYCTEN